MVISEVVTLFFYVVSIAFLPEYFGTSPSAGTVIPASSKANQERSTQICRSSFLFDLHGRLPLW